MPRGDSGRLVIEIDPERKRLLYEALDAEGVTMKDWFLRQVQEYLETHVQPDLFGESQGRLGHELQGE